MHAPVWQRHILNIISKGARQAKCASAMKCLHDVGINHSTEPSLYFLRLLICMHERMDIRIQYYAYIAIYVLQQNDVPENLVLRAYTFY